MDIHWGGGDVLPANGMVVSIIKSEYHKKLVSLKASITKKLISWYTMNHISICEYLHI